AFHHSSVEHFLEKYPGNALLIGNPGAGKTYSILNYSTKVARKLQDTCLNDAPLCPEISIPVYIDLKFYHDDLWDMTQKMFPPTLSLDSLCASYRVHFFIDAVNELPREYLDQGRFDADITSFLQRIGHSRVIFGSRTTDRLEALGLP